MLEWTVIVSVAVDEAAWTTGFRRIQGGCFRFVRFLYNECHIFACLGAVKSPSVRLPVKG